MEEYSPEHVERVAKAAHEMNRLFCKLHGDFSQPAWEDAPDWQQDSAMNGVRLHLGNEGTTAEQSHESWIQQKFDEGWKYGPVKDPEKKEHPCMLPYCELPPAQRAKDSIFKAVVDSFR